jgi:hypothetical protein
MNVMGEAVEAHKFVATHLYPPLSFVVLQGAGT